jgi:dTMP kinase
LTTREPGGTAGAEAIRALVVEGSADRWDALAELFLMMAARQDHIQRLILPAIHDGKWVLSDRFHDSSRVYQGIAGGLGVNLVDSFHKPMLREAMPDLTVLIDIEPSVGLARASQSGTETRFEEKGSGFHWMVRDGFRTLAEIDPERFIIVDGARSTAEVTAAILRGIAGRFGLQELVGD